MCIMLTFVEINQQEDMCKIAPNLKNCLGGLILSKTLFPETSDVRV